MVVVTAAGMAVAIMAADTVVGTRMAAGIMAGLALREALDMAVRTSVRCAMHPSVVRISAMGSICTPVCFATAV